MTSTTPTSCGGPTNIVEEIESAGPTDPLCRQAGIDLDREGETP
jgi:hypothetical protein